MVVMGSSGSLSLEALHWLAQLEVPLLVIDPKAGPIFASALPGPQDGRLRRLQALAPEGELGLEITRRLLGSKLESQAALLRGRLQREAEASTIEELAQALTGAPSLADARQLEASAAACYWQAWSGHPLTEVRFARRDLPRVPEHWRSFQGRRSVLASVNANRRAERPLNAVLNYLGALAAAEATLAALRLGLDPALGIVHADARGRAGLSWDLLEPVRPALEAYALDLVERRSFRRWDFSEAPDGHVRLNAPLSHDLAATLPRWQSAVAPWAELVARTLGEAIAGRYQATAPLSGRLRRQAQAEVKARRALARVQSGLAAASPASKQQPLLQAELPLEVSCRECGAVIPGRPRRYCPACGVLQPGFDAASRARRGRAIALARGALEAWRAEHPGASADPEEFRAVILPGLQRVRLREIMAALDCAKSTASLIRSGRHLPALRHWPALARLAGVGQPGSRSG